MNQLISIPLAKLQNYRSVPVHLTEDDIRDHIKLEEEEIVEERIALIRSKKTQVLESLSRFQTHKRVDMIARALNNLLIDDIYTKNKDC